MSKKKPSQAWSSGFELSDAEYAALITASHGELLNFAVRVCKKVVDYRGSKSMRITHATDIEEIKDSLLCRVLEKLDKSIYGKQASQNANPGKSRLEPAYKEFAALHAAHRHDYKKRAPFVRFAKNNMAEPSPCLSTLDGWAKNLDAQSAR
jgi:hypothetical protein